MRYAQRFSFAFDFPVYFTTGSLAPSNPILREAITRREQRKHRVAVVIERRVAELWPDLETQVAGYLSNLSTECDLRGVRLLEGGEECKNEQAPKSIYTWFDELGLDRQSAVIAIGGGALQDLVGYAAGIFHRGLRLIRMPTTVLSQNDSGVGVKNGINAFGKKNALGTFAPPFAVINDFDFLTTLGHRDRVAGMAEAIKVALIKDRAFFDWLGEHADALARFERGAVATLVQRCAELHLQHIANSGDPFELGSARPLDYGHWAAHKLESLSHYALRHGEAVAIGLALDTRYSAEINLLPAGDVEKVVSLLERLGFVLWTDLLDTRNAKGQRAVLAGIEEFREHLGGQLCVTMLRSLGQGVEIHELDTHKIDSTIDWLKSRTASSSLPVSAAVAP
ncbi:MAG TPA: 3-dehydroquinate synthase [Polyangiaceae bacterium]|nr:3-dehydroquinate synthase [Polyangiaceae bacterium]